MPTEERKAELEAEPTQQEVEIANKLCELHTHPKPNADRVKELEAEFMSLIAEQDAVIIAEFRWLFRQHSMTAAQREHAINSVLSRCLAEKAREQINREKEPRR